MSSGKSTILQLLIPFCFATLFACGGGSTGTGVKTFIGDISFPDGAPVAQVSVVIPASGAQTATDNAGHFEVDTELESGDSQVNFVAQGVESSVEIEAVPEGNAEINMEVVLDEPSLTVASANVEIKKKDKTHDNEGSNSEGGAESATPTPEATAVVSPSETPTPGEEGEVTPTPDETPTDTPTPEETVGLPPEESPTPTPVESSTPTVSPTVSPTATSTPSPTPGG